MATFAREIFCLVLLVLSTYCQTEARQSRLFFSKYVHLATNANKNYVTLHNTNAKKSDLSSSISPHPAPVPESQISNAPTGALDYENAPAPAPSMSSNYGNAPVPAPMMGSNYENAPAPVPLDGGYAPAPLQSETWYYGLYAKGKSDSINDKEVEEDEEFSNEDFSNRNGEEFNSREETNTYNNGYSDSLSNNNAFLTSNNKIYSTNHGYDNINNGYENEPQGMSDTRLMNNGKYYYNTERENYGPNGNELVRENENEEGYNGSYQRSKYEFDTMEEYEKEEGYVGVEQEFTNP